jgi:site-specific DNA-methyltransferase (adenine-specific)
MSNIGFKFIEDKSIQMILTDIPYEQTNNRLNYNLREIHKGDADISTFNLEEFLKECVRVCNGTIYVFCATEQVSFVRAFLDTSGFTTRLCIWEKTNPSPANGQYMWLSGIETCVFAQKSKRYGGNPVFNEHCKNTVWRFPNGKSKIHPTQKPLELFEYLIKVSSNEGDLVLDPCVGSGTTAVAAKRLHRKFIGFEINEEYYKIANERIQDIVHKVV